MSECPLCSIKPYFSDYCIDGTTWSRFDSSKLLSSGPWTWLKACKDKDNRLALYAVGDDYSDLHYPKFCPECGRRLE